MPSIASADSYLLADLQSYSGLPAPVASRRLHAELKVATQTWFEKYRSHTRAAEAESRALHALNPAVFATSTYPGAGATQLRFCSDFMAYFFMLDDIAEERDLRDNAQIADIVLNALNHPTTDKSTARLAIMSRDLMRRFAMTGTATVQRRFITAFGYYFQGLEEQTQLRVQGRIPTLDEYVRIRRDTTGCKLCWVIVEWAYNLDIPEDVLAHPVIYGLGEAVNDLVAWSNDLYSYSVERSKGDNHNMVAVVMHHDGTWIFSPQRRTVLGRKD
ncbi:Terpene cyclase [Mycena chlorophos]|uniref:Terpene synthase n=1 Tax=Mycena chlorophos TaxID=658473 RepID=A0A8H6VZW2_MYCCL|nr:Terpene cyclase [Mycena chlorophos]